MELLTLSDNNVVQNIGAIPSSPSKGLVHTTNDSAVSKPFIASISKFEHAPSVQAVQAVQSMQSMQADKPPVMSCHPDDEGGVMRMYSGGNVSLANPQVCQINLTDVAHNLSMQCRFTGSVIKFYSIAQHVYIASVLVKKYKKETLHHDDPEAMISDLNRPLKTLLFDYIMINMRFERVFAYKYSLEYPWPAEVKAIDNSMLVTEAQQLLKPVNIWWSTKDGWPPQLPIKIRPWSPKHAKFMYIMRHYELVGFNGSKVDWLTRQWYYWCKWVNRLHGIKES